MYGSTVAVLLSDFGVPCGKMFFWMKYLVLDILALYKAFLSPWFPPACRFEPTCSQYAAEAVERYGAIRGTWMGLLRILRCQPFCTGGHDPVK